MSMSYIMIWQQENALISLNNFYCFNFYDSLAKKAFQYDVDNFPFIKHLQI